ncbi:hypothetical protein CBL_13592 [Carabus blaptoides fortunei]
MQPPTRRSLLDIVKNKEQERSILGKNECAMIIESIVNSVNTNCEHGEEKITGFLLVYSKYFVHFLQCSERCVRKHFIFLQEQQGNTIVQIKLIMALHNTVQRMFDKWICTETKPLNKINPRDIEPNYTNIKHLIWTIYVKNIYQLAFKLRNHQPEIEGQISFNTIQDKIAQYLPDSDIIGFLIGLPCLLDLQQILRMFQPLLEEKTKLIWPVPDKLYPKSIGEESETI